MRIARGTASHLSRLVVLLALAGLPLAPGSAGAQNLEPVGQLRSSGSVTSPASEKIMSRLRALIADFRSLGITSRNAAAMGATQRFSSEALWVDAGGRVHVDVTVADTSDGTLAQLRHHGLDIEIVNADFRVVEGWIPVERLEPLAAEPAVLKARPPSYATPRTGAVNSQGDAIHRCDQARAMGFTGSGAAVGVISDGVAGLAASQATGDLPAVTVLTNSPGDEGTALLEIVHDCAPGAPLLFATGSPTALAFINAVNALHAAGGRIIVDDLGFYGEPYFQDGMIALNDRAVGNSVLRVSAAGNDRGRHYAALFNPGVFDSQIPGTRHNFGGGDTLIRFTSPGGTSPVVFLQWANLFGAAGDDYDLCVRLPSGGLVDCSAFVQDGNDDPIEIVQFSCPPGPECAGDIQITRFSGAARPLKLFCLGCTLQQFAVTAGSIFGHPAVPEVLAVAAAFSGTPTVSESFSSAGPSTIQFPAPEVRPKPDVTGIDGVSTTRPGFNPFFGTSAAAPHVAAIAALILATNPGLSPPQVRAILANTAVDLGPAGFDFDSGFGRADAVNAIAATPFTAGVFVATGRIDGTPGAEIITGPGPGGGPHVKVFQANGIPLGPGFMAYDPAFTGGVRVASGCDFDGDGRDETVTGAGPGGGPHVRVFKLDTAGNVVGQLASFYAYHPAFTGGVFVACGDVDGDGVPEIITGADAGGGPHVRVLRIQGGTVASIFEFFAYNPPFIGGVRVAAGNVDGSDRASVITAAGPGGGPHVRAIKLLTSGGAVVGTTDLASFFAYNPAFTGGVFVAAGNVTGDGRAEIITGADAGGGPHVRVVTGTGADTGIGFFAYNPAFAGGARVASGNLDAAGTDEIVTAAGPTGGPHVVGFTGAGAPTGTSFFAY